jgi:COMPASS component BRE2
MSDPVIPLKRSASPPHHTRSVDKKPVLVVNKYKPGIVYRPSDFEEFKPAPQAHGDGFNNPDVPLNTRQGFMYKPCRPNPHLETLKFSTTDIPPFQVCLDAFDRSALALISDSYTKATTERGWVSVRANVAITEGKWFFEFRVVKSDDTKHVRLGIGRREASLEAPIGFDAYGYGLRDKTGDKVHLSRPKQFMNDGFKKGDVIGIVVELPKAEFTDVTRAQVAMRYKNNLYYEKFDYVPTKKMDHLLNPVTVFGEKAVVDANSWRPESLEGSCMKVYKNGEFMGTCFEDLYAFLPPNSELTSHKLNKDGKYVNNGSLGYYPTISVFNGGVAELNAGPNFDFKPSDLGDDVRGLHELYHENIADDIVWDLVDEIEAETLEDPTLSSFIKQ